MKKVLGLIFITVLGLTLSGCISSQANESHFDIVNNKDSLYEFVNNEVYQISRKEYDSSMKITYLDVTNDGVLDAVMYNDGDWSQNIFIVTVQENKFKHIKTDVKVAKYSNLFEMKDGFFIVTQQTGGTGVMQKDITLAVYSNDKMVTVLENLKISSTSTFQNITYEDKAEIKGTYADFEYTLTRTQDDESAVIEHAFYKYDRDKLKFLISKQ